MMTGLIAGFTLATARGEAAPIQTPSDGLVAGPIAIAVADGTLPATPRASARRPMLPAALDFLARAFGFAEAMRHETPSGGMHAQMLLDGQRIMLGQGAGDWNMASPAESRGAATTGIFIYIDDVDGHFARARDAGAEIVHPPKDEPYGRTYTARDLDGHPWFFTKAPS